MKVKVLGGPNIAEGLLTKQSEQDRGPGRNDHSNRTLQDPRGIATMFSCSGLQLDFLYTLLYINHDFRCAWEIQSPGSQAQHPSLPQCDTSSL